MSILNTNLFEELFLYIPQGKSSQFKQQYSENDKYKSKIAFIEDTHEIYVNGKSFGYNYDEAIEEIWNILREHASNISTINSNIDLIQTLINNEQISRETKDSELNTKYTNLLNNYNTLEQRVSILERRI